MRGGFVFFIVITMFLVLGLLAFALTTMKTGAVEQLAKTVDQNRLAILVQAGNNEGLAMIRSKINQNNGNTLYAEIRQKLAGFEAGGTSFPCTIPIWNGYVPAETQKLAKETGYAIKVVSKADLVVFRQGTVKGQLAYQGYLEITTRAYHDDAVRNSIELKERRDVKLLDIRDFLDKYILYVKNYSPDYNNCRRKVVLIGLENSLVKPGTGVYSRAYFGSRFPPASVEFQGDPSPPVWFDVWFNEAADQTDESDLLTGLLGFTTRVAFPDSPEKHFYWVGEKKFTDVNPSARDKYYGVEEIKIVYEGIVNAACNGILGGSTVLQGDQLKAKCVQAKNKLNNNNAAAYKIVEDFANRASGRNYGSCAHFKTVLDNCWREWTYRYGYTDAASIWKVDGRSPNARPDPYEWVKNAKYCGLATETAFNFQKGQYFNEYLDDAGGKSFNIERARVGKMMQLFNWKGDRRKVFIEGPAFLRYFKLAFFEFFKTDFATLAALTPDSSINNIPITFPPVPILFSRKDRPTTFVNATFSAGITSGPKAGMSGERYFMSRPVDHLALNCLTGWSSAPGVMKPDGGITSYDPNSGPWLYPQIKTASGQPKDGAKFFRVIDWGSPSHNYRTSKDLHAGRVRVVGNTKTLFLDGVIFLEQGPLDLSTVHAFRGKGLIFVGKGDCRISTMRRALRGSEKVGDHSLRIYLAGGDFQVEGPGDPVEIEASLLALTYVPPSSGGSESDLNNQGSLYCNGKNVTILGNLVLDYLAVDCGAAGLPDGGTLRIIHDPLIFNPVSPSDGVDPYWVSVSSIRTLYSLNAGEKSFQ